MSSSTSFPYLLMDSKSNLTSNNSSPPSTSSFSIDTILSNQLSTIPIQPDATSPYTTFATTWPFQAYPFFSMFCSPLMPQLMPPYQHFVSSRRKRRHRTIFSEEQLNILETTFVSTQYPGVELREKLASQCALKEERVEVWFKNRRAKERKTTTKREDGSENSRNKLSDGSECDESDDEMRKLKKMKKEKEESSSPEQSSKKISSPSDS